MSCSSAVFRLKCKKQAAGDPQSDLDQLTLLSGGDRESWWRSARAVGICEQVCDPRERLLWMHRYSSRRKTERCLVVLFSGVFHYFLFRSAPIWGQSLIDSNGNTIPLAVFFL